MSFNIQQFLGDDPTALSRAINAAEQFRKANGFNEFEISYVLPYNQWLAQFSGGHDSRWIPTAWADTPAQAIWDAMEDVSRIGDSQTDTAEVLP